MVGGDNFHNKGCSAGAAEKETLILFGTIDLPEQGGIVSGTSYYNFGWALTPLPETIPKDGSAIWVWVDGVKVGHPVYDQYTKDIADAYPEYNNANGAVGYLNFPPFLGQ